MNVDILPDNVLLDIFDHHRHEVSDSAWIRNERFKLTHVCRGWRIILDSPSRLDVKLLCTQGKPVKEMLLLSPPLPIIVDYTRDRMSSQEEEGALYALTHSHRVCEVKLRVNLHSFNRLVAAIDAPFPNLKRLELGSEQGYNVRLPPSFLGGRAPPHLHDVSLNGAIPLAAPPWVSPSIRYFHLHQAWNSMDAIPPQVLNGIICNMPHLQILNIYLGPPFHETPNKQASTVPIAQWATLAKLEDFEFHGDGSYLDLLVSNLDAPSLTRVSVHLSGRPTSNVPHATRFISQLKQPQSFEASMIVWAAAATIRVPHSPAHDSSSALVVKIKSRSTGEAIDNMTWLCSQLSHWLSSVRCLSLGPDSDIPLAPSTVFIGSSNDLPRWRSLFEYFGNITTLYVNELLARGIADALPKDAEDPAAYLLPQLQEVTLQVKNEGSKQPFLDAFDIFAMVRRLSGRVVSVRCLGME
ncbi:hypothetical protein BC834DRAFT_855482 [Gloeopeniophorella convolvens]|nr:hypothetical protein BC834DRAFT_855482 [Gloeopeniophorella convolvens]